MPISGQLADLYQCWAGAKWGPLVFPLAFGDVGFLHVSNRPDERTNMT